MQYTSIFAVGILLFVVTLIINLIAVRVVRRFRTVYQ
jgi:phosphate transport system permease protein